MKKYSFLLDQRLVNDYFKPLRTKIEIIELLMKSIKFILVDKPVDEDRKVGEIVLVVAKMSRLFYFSEEKYFSIAFPFSVIENGNYLEFTSSTVPFVDSKVTSDVLGVLAKSGAFEQDCAFEFVEPIVEISDQEQLFWPFLLNLFMYEDGYIRYDYDVEHHNGSLHPLNHFDFFYSSISTCKVGLNERLNNQIFIDFLHTETDCRFIKLHTQLS